MAVTEYCPAYIRAEHAFDMANGAAALWSYEIAAFGPRSVRGDILAQTTDGWYTFEFPSAPLTRAGEGNFVSPALYITFPHPVTLLRWWVRDAQTSDDAFFGWNQRGAVECPPRVIAVTESAARSWWPADKALLSPSPRESIVEAVPIAAPDGASACERPFGAAQAERVPPVDFPSTAERSISGSTDVTVTVAINAEGTIDDAWISGPSDIPALDKEALRVARESTYRSTIAFCRPVPTFYEFIVTFTTV